MRIITGHRGDVGSTLYKLYQQGDSGNVFPFDGRNQKDIKQFIHLAARHPKDPLNEIINSNIHFLDEVVRYSEDNGVIEFIFFSSTSIYGSLPKEGITEKDPFFHPDAYGISKMMGEKRLELSRIKAICLRLPGILELRNSNNLLSKWFDKLVSDEEIAISNPDKLFNSFISPENIFDFVSNLTLTQNFDSLNLAVDRTHTLREVVELLKHILGSSSKIMINETNGGFCSFSTEKAKMHYNFKAHDIENTLKSWCVKRKIQFASKMNNNIKGRN
jgi:nucleoside-diphosphate-sugar epimerase